MIKYTEYHYFYRYNMISDKAIVKYVLIIGILS